MKGKLLILGGLVIFNLVYSILLHILPNKESPLNYLFNVSYSLIFLFGAITAFATVKTNIFRTDMGRGMFYYVVAFLSYVLALLVWTFYNLILKESVPYPSAPDFFFIIFQIMSLAGFVYIVRGLGGKFNLGSIFEFILLFGIIFAMLYSFLSLSSLGPELPLIEKILNVLYPLLDAMLIALAIVGLRTDMGQLHLNLLIFVFASLIMAFADITFSYRSAQDIYWNGDIADVLYLLAAALFSFGIVSLTTQNNLILKPSGNLPDNISRD